MAELKAVDFVYNVGYVPIARTFAIERQNIFFERTDVMRTFGDQFRLVFSHPVAGYIKLDFTHGGGYLFRVTAIAPVIGLFGVLAVFRITEFGIQLCFQHILYRISEQILQHFLDIIYRFRLIFFHYLPQQFVSFRFYSWLFHSLNSLILLYHFFGVYTIYFTRSQAFADMRSNLYYHQTMQFTIETDAGEETIDASIDYWTDGALTAIAEVVAQIESITEHMDRVSTAELVQLLNNVQNLNQQLANACQRAKDCLICSQMRAEISGNLADQLQQSGWEFVDYTYEGEEMNAPLHVKLRDMSGNEIVAIISQQQLQNAIGTNMEINFFDPYNNDANIRGVWVDGIIESLRRSGLDVGKPIVRPGYEVRQSDNEAIRDLEATAGIGK